MATKKRSAEKPKVESVTGQVIAVDWDEDDQPTVVAILTENDEEILVESNPKGDELLERIDAMVHVSGVINRDEAEPVINIQAYEILEREASDDEDFEDFEDEEFEEDEFEDEDLEEEEFEDEELDDEDDDEDD